MKTHVANNWLNAFDIKVKQTNENYSRNFSGAVWVKNYALMDMVKKHGNSQKNL